MSYYVQRRKKMDTYNNEDLIKYFNLYSKMVYRLAFIQLKTREQAEDILQDVFIKLMGQSTSFESDEHVKAWLLKTTINCCKDYWKSAWFRKRVSLEETSEATTTSHTNTTYGFVTECVKRLPIKYRQIIHLYYYEEYSLSEIAHILALNENTVRTRMSRGRQLLKKYLGKEADNYEF